MKQSDENNEIDNQLADFTDRLLKGRTEDPASISDEELLSLERTIVRLTDTFPSEPLEDAKVKQMLVRLKARAKREEEQVKPSFWKRIFDFQSNPQVGLLIGAAVIVILVLISIPISSGPGSSLSGAADSGGGNPYIALGLMGILFIIYWVSRRK